jgi:hypothetical protein
MLLYVILMFITEVRHIYVLYYLNILHIHVKVFAIWRMIASTFTDIINAL